MEFRAFKNQVKSLAEFVNTEKDHTTSEADVRRSLVLPLFNFWATTHTRRAR